MGDQQGVLGGHLGFLIIDLEGRHILEDIFTLKKIPLEFCFDIFIRRFSAKGDHKGGTSRTLRVFDWRDGGGGHP